MRLLSHTLNFDFLFASSECAFVPRNALDPCADSIQAALTSRSRQGMQVNTRKDTKSARQTQLLTTDNGLQSVRKTDQVRTEVNSCQNRFLILGPVAKFDSRHMGAEQEQCAPLHLPARLVQGGTKQLAESP